MRQGLTELSPVIKWAGGKEQELKYILPNVPYDFTRYIEPFVGGGAVYFAIDCKEKLINDKSVELMNLYKNVKENNSNFVKSLQDLQLAWIGLENILNVNLPFFSAIYLTYKKSKINKSQLEDEIRHFLNKNSESFKGILNSILKEQFAVFEDELFRYTTSKLIRMKELEIKKGDLPESDIVDNFECALKGSFYMFIRKLYNQDHFKNSHYFYFIREYCYSSMFRYNSNGEFNVPYGGISYNKKNFAGKIKYIKSRKLQRHFSNTRIFNLDFEKFLNGINLASDDFIFLDPPYDTDFSSYVNNSFDKHDQIRLADFLAYRCPARFMLVVKNTEFISELYSEKGFYIVNFDKKYSVSFKNRNNKDSEHLIILNYPIEGAIYSAKPSKLHEQPQYLPGLFDAGLCFGKTNYFAVT